jgi:molecular chaperone GrpE
MSESDPNSVAPDMATAPGPEPMVDPAARIAALEAEVADLKDKALRAHAELENYRRRAEREREDTAKYAVTKFARDLLSVADNLRRAIDNAPKEGDEAVKALLAGVEVTERELLTAFERHQVKPIEALGQRFDANFHEAVVEIPDPSKPAGTIVQVMAPGYTIAGRLLRAAMVGVAKGGPKEPSGQAIDTNA